MSRRERPLTAEEADLARRYAPLARKIARRSWRGRPQDRHEIVSDAMLALCRAARDWEPALTENFATYAHYQVRYALLSTARRLRARRFGSHPVGRSTLSSWAGTGDSTEAADEVIRLLRSIPPRHALAVRLTVMDGVLPSEAARALGVSRSRLFAIRAEGLRWLQHPASDVA